MVSINFDEGRSFLARLCPVGLPKKRREVAKTWYHCVGIDVL